MLEYSSFHPVSLFIKGGFFMWPLLLCSIIGLAVILDRAVFFIFLGRGSDLPRFLRRSLEGGASPGLLAASLRNRRHPIAAVAATYLENLSRPDSLRAELVRAEGGRQLERVEARLRILATISHLSPLLGLLGTVTGLVIAFAQMQVLGAAAQPADLAGGIWEALLTTVFGLIVAIPCMAAYHGYEGLADRIARNMAASVVLLDDICEAQQIGEHFSCTASQAESVAQGNYTGSEPPELNVVG